MVANTKFLKTYIASQKAPEIALDTWISDQSGVVGFMGTMRIVEAHAELQEQVESLETRNRTLSAQIEEIEGGSGDGASADRIRNYVGATDEALTAAGKRKVLEQLELPSDDGSAENFSGVVMGHLFRSD
jgi:hypothetical protein